MRVDRYTAVDRGGIVWAWLGQGDTPPPFPDLPFMDLPADRRSVTSLAARSEPLTVKPRFSSTSAMPLMPAPPMPTSQIRLPASKGHQLVRDVELYLLAVGAHDCVREADRRVAPRPVEGRLQHDLFGGIAL